MVMDGGMYTSSHAMSMLLIVVLLVMLASWYVTGWLYGKKKFGAAMRYFIMFLCFITVMITASIMWTFTI